MGTRGYRVYRHKGRYYVYYNHYDSYPSGLGVQVLAEIPRGDEETYRAWIQELRDSLDRKLENLDDGNGTFSISEERPQNDLWIEWIYELDLDHEVFLVDTHPLFALNNMPDSDELFCACIGFNSYGHRGYSLSTPLQHIYNWKSEPPKIEDSVIADYAARQSTPDRVDLTISELLEVPTDIGDCEAVRIGLYEAIVGGNMQEHPFGINIRLLETVSERVDIPNYLLSWGEQVLRVVFERMLFGYDEEVELSSAPGLDLLWLAEDVCLRITTHLDDERNLKKNIIDIVDDIARQRNSNTVVYGVLFSFFHCVVLEVDQRNGFRSTPALQFLPSLYATSSSTPGITAVVRLAYHTMAPFEIPGTENTFPSDHFLQKLPLEVLEGIATNLGPSDLESLHLAAWIFKPAAFRMLRYPHINGYRLDGVLQWSDSKQKALEKLDARSHTSFHTTNKLFSASIDGSLGPDLHVKATNSSRLLVSCGTEQFAVKYGATLEVARDS
ncbi:hypothetical protein GGX14DRAFT_525603 [Mycena pura]|uniref:F-box domain-containing protein n=1 Tax=Mycena pura TaxID=153505 RepID=A0AAD6UZH3_9AGAR|nr:hypothetical protein GGX14DRAFT_525603 [Mycena pura]